MKISLAQIQPVPGDLSANIEQHIRWIEVAAVHGVDVIVFPELSLTGYEPKLAKILATDPQSARLDSLQAVSASSHITICAGLPVPSASGVLIGMVIFQPNGQRQLYAKQMLHPDEEPYFATGEKQVILTIKNTTLAPAICYEALQPEHAANAHELGAVIYLASVAKPHRGVEKAVVHFPMIAKKYAMPVLMANSVGFCDNFESAGQSSVWDDQGDLLAQLDAVEEGMLIFDTKTKAIRPITIAHLLPSARSYYNRRTSCAGVCGRSRVLLH